MTEPEMLAAALKAQEAGGPFAPVQVFIPRHPHSRYIKELRVRPKQGPRGRIVSLTAEGTFVEFEARRLIVFLSAIGAGTDRVGVNLPRVQIHPKVSRINVERITEISLRENCSISEVVDLALTEHLERRA